MTDPEPPETWQPPPPGPVVTWVRSHPTSGPIAVAAVSTVSLAFIGAVDPNEDGHYPTCPSIVYFNVNCPGCGTLRGLHALAGGDPVGLVARNAVLPVGMFFVAWWWLRWFATSIGRTFVPAVPDLRPYTKWFVAALVAYGIARNLPWAPFTALAP